MTTLTSPLSSLTSATASSASSATPAAGAGNGTTVADTAQAQDRFLKLLVAQLNNQDPMNPMDNAQMTSQMAQINTVTGVQQLNDTVKALSAQFSSMQLLQGAALVGREVLTQGNTLSRDGKTASGSLELAGVASSVKVEVLSPGGQVVGSVDLGALPAGRKDFSWDASGYSASGTLSYRVVAQNAGQAVTSTTYSRDKVVSVGMDNGAPSLQLASGTRVNPANVAAVL